MECIMVRCHSPQPLPFPGKQLSQSTPDIDFFHFLPHQEVMFCYVLRPANLSDDEMTSPRCIPRFRVQEILMRRWVSSRERDLKDQLPPLISWRVDVKATIPVMFPVWVCSIAVMDTHYEIGARLSSYQPQCDRCNNMRCTQLKTWSSILSHCTN